MPPNYRAKSQKATEYIRAHTFVGIGTTTAEAMAMWNRLATEAERTLSTAAFDVVLDHARTFEQLQGKDNPATDYPATDYPATDYAPPVGPNLHFYTAVAVYKQVAKAGSSGRSTRKSTTKKSTSRTTKKSTAKRSTAKKSTSRKSTAKKRSTSSRKRK
jgi:hypothetical protein